MDNFFYTSAIYAWLSLAVLFFIISFFVRTKFIWLAVVLNVLFLSTSYIVVAETVGQGKPINNTIPLYHHGNWKDGVDLLSAWWDDKKIYLLVKEEEKPILYVINRNDKLVDEIANEFKEAQKNGKRVMLQDGTDYGDTDTSSHIHIKENPKHSFIPKTDQGDSDENYETK
jgi:hypothetical protein